MNNDKIFRIYRPLVFLCGPFFDENNPNDRRNVLLNYISSKNETISINKSKTKFALIPIIVDSVFNDDNNQISRFGLSLKILEEIVASISHRTFIFLDSLSTSFEYGLFNNGISRNRSIVLLEHTYFNRKRRSIGKYLLKTIPKADQIIYEREMTKTYEDNEYNEFPKNNSGKSVIPDSIKNKIDLDFIELKEKAKSGFKISFVDSASKDIKLTEIATSYSSDFHSIHFKINSRLAFYLSVMALSNPNIKKAIEKQNFEKEYNIYKQYIFDLFIETSLNNKTINTAALITRNPDITLEIDKYSNTFEIFKHIVFVYYSITKLIKKPFNKTVNSLRSNREISPSFNRITDYNYVNSLFEIQIRDKNLIDDYCNNPDDYVENRIIKVSGKNRRIIQYKNTHKGRHLMRLHKEMADKLSSLFPPSAYAYAYKKETCIKMCLEQHLKSNHFIKLDVHSFFNSLTTKNVCRSFLKRIMTTLDIRFKPLGPKLKMVDSVLKCCFYKGHLPLGFVTSPILSDIYMNAFDKQIGDNFPSIKYTRYADDILISSKKKTKKLKECEREIIVRLSNLKLATNTNKRLMISLKNEGDSIRFLGVNIVKRDKTKEFTISKSRLLDYAERIYKEKHKKHPDESKVKGIINYVRSISEISYFHLRKSYLAMFKEDF